MGAHETAGMSRQRTRPTLTWTPTGAPLPRTTSLDEVVDVVARGNVAILSGAGLSTESGIPDYRGEAGSLRKHVPMTYSEFTSTPYARQRYWARSHVGWHTIAAAAPNSGHLAVTALHAAGLLTGVITQNVDGLHQAAGTPDVIDLHGNLDRVICLQCRQQTPRTQLDERLRAANPDFVATSDVINPDGDVELAEAATLAFTVVGCHSCGGVLKPDVVFFGENVPAERVRDCNDLVDSAAAVLVLGSSLTVMSGLRFVRRAAGNGTPVLIVTLGETRGDPHATVRVDRPLGPALTELVARLS
ncbi:NAD-dependent protein deacetylase [Actinokineospora diospyrosa]|uniref:NAD-dependent protein deacetylase n=1 Tax=Actinokineospora diospyrosa TaxID=103728 RepID=A0ABT1IPC3_9PSEU|nr:NAD-dependent protein deacetylase [Actinokineospora diospyrosa]MCP2274399.1 NAD-dependent protein deacetylase, SIR2 family [Actinokineospora diospyrosa]